MSVFVYHLPIGNITLTDDGFAIVRLSFGENVPTDEAYEESPLLKKAYAQLCAYFKGERKSFDLPLAPQGTAFQKQVWQALASIPYGETRSYSQIAQSIGREKACRAVGSANNKNPLAIFIPCHRVIGKNGSPVGYAGGLDVKAFLLKLEAQE